MNWIIMCIAASNITFQFYRLFHLPKKNILNKIMQNLNTLPVKCKESQFEVEQETCCI